MLTIVFQEYKKIDTGSSRVQYEQNGQQLIPEKVAIEYYKNQGYDCIWAENDYWGCVLSLLYWDVIFAKIQGAVTVSRNNVTEELDPQFSKNYDNLFDSFIKLNGMPSDLFSVRFTRNREELIKARYRQIENTDIFEEIIKQYTKHKGKNCRLIPNWDKFSTTQLIEPLKVLDKVVVLRILLQLIRNISMNRSGFPDLLVYKTNEIKFIEVKSENDSLSQNQKHWITFLGLDLNQNVELFLINHNQKVIDEIKDSFQLLMQPISIEIGQTTSKEKDKMISIFQLQENYIEGINPTASFSILNNEIKEIVKTVGRWKTSNFFVGDKEYTVEQIRNAVYEYWDRKNFILENQVFWCYPYEYGCTRIDAINTNNLDWKEFGYTDKDAEEWVFNLVKIQNVVKSQIEENVLCPYIDIIKIEKDFLKLPERINPRKDKDWSFVDHISRKWIYHNNNWITSYSEDSFPGITAIVGVCRLSMEEQQEIIQTHSKYQSYSYNESGTSLKNSVNQRVKSNSTGCMGLLLFLFVLGTVIFNIIGLENGPTTQTF